MRKGFIYTLVLSILFVGAMVALAPEASAQALQTGEDIPTSIVTCSGIGEGGEITCDWCSFVKLIGNLIKYAIFLAVTVSSLMFAYAGFLFLTNNGNPQKVTAAWEIFRRVIYGIIGILAAWLIVNAIMTKVAGNEEWMTLECADTASIDTTYGGDLESETTYGSYGGGGSAGIGNDITSAEYEAELARREEERRLAEARRQAEENARIRAEEYNQLQSGDAPKVVTPPTEYGKQPPGIVVIGKYREEVWNGLNNITVRVLGDLHNACDSCFMIHANKMPPDDSQDGVYTYANGVKVDIAGNKSTRFGSALTRFITTHNDSFTFISDDESTALYADKCGNLWSYNKELETDSYSSWTLTAQNSVTERGVGTSCF